MTLPQQAELLSTRIDTETTKAQMQKKTMKNAEANFDRQNKLNALKNPAIIMAAKNEAEEACFTKLENRLKVIQKRYASDAAELKKQETAAWAAYDADMKLVEQQFAGFKL